MSNWLGVCEGLFATAVPAVGLIYTYSANRRAQYDRVLALTEQSFTVPVVDDRHLIGTLFEPAAELPRGKPVTLGEADIKALFNVLWYFERAYALYLSLRPPLGSARITRAQALLLDSLASAINTWQGYLSIGWADSAGREVDAADACRGLLYLASEHSRLSNTRARRDDQLPPRPAWPATGLPLR